jgi:two-component system, NtrC family, sensor kinase
MEAHCLMANRCGDFDECECLFRELTKYYRHAIAGRRLTGIIHNINTPLQVILMQSELMERKLQEEQKTFAPLLPADLQESWQAFFAYRQNKNRQLQEVSANLQQVIHWLKHHTSHEEHQGRQEIDLNELLLTELEGYQAEQFYKHRVEKRFQGLDRLPPISGFYVDFSQSFTNLVDNALEALLEVPEPVLTINTRMESGCRIIAVGDNGPGIPEEIQNQIFNPLFSTKSTAEKPRAGLGLFLTRRLLTPYGGEVSFESRPGQTWFRLVLP